MTNQPDLFGFEELPKKAVQKVAIVHNSPLKVDTSELVQIALKRLRNALKPESEKLLREWVFSYEKYGINDKYHVMAYNIGLLKVLKVDNETILNELLWKH